MTEEIHEQRFPFEHPAAAEAYKLHAGLRKRYPIGQSVDIRRDINLLLVVRWEYEIMNGGIDQFMTNGSGDYTAETLEALKAIGAKQSYHYLKQACGLFPDGMPSEDYETRDAQHVALCKSLGNSECRSHVLEEMIRGEVEYELYQLLVDWYHTQPSQ